MTETHLLKNIFIFTRKMVQYEKIDISEGIDLDKTRPSKECMLCHYWYFKDVGYKFEPNVCNKCHNVLVTAYRLKNIAILNVKVLIFDVIYGVLIKMKLLLFCIILC